MPSTPVDAIAECQPRLTHGPEQAGGLRCRRRSGHRPAGRPLPARARGPPRNPAGVPSPRARLVLARGGRRAGRHQASRPQEVPREDLMFERFTKEARAAVVGAQEVARDTGSRSIDTRHLLIALVESRGPAYRALRQAGADVEAFTAKARAELRAGGIDGDALAGIGIDLDAVRRQADEVFGPGALERAARAPGGHIPFTP